MKYKFKDIAINSTIKKKPEDNDKYNYIGLEHLVPGNLFVDKYGSEVAPIGEKLLMKKGDVLFGKRRAYQKKVAIAPCDGIFSAHGMVLRPNEDIVNKEYFPFFISSDNFLNEAIRISVGSLSPTINWRDLKELEFYLPSIEEQEHLAKLLWAAYELKESYKKLIVATDEMVKAQFIELFESRNNRDNYNIQPLSQLIETTFVGEWGIDDNDNNGVKVIRTTNFTNLGNLDYTNVVTRNIDSIKVEKKSLVYGDILLEKSGGTKDNPVGRVVFFDKSNDIYLCNNFIVVLRPKVKIDSRFLFTTLFIIYNTQKDKIRSMGNQTTGIQNLKVQQYLDMNIVVPPIEVQREYVKIVLQADKSKAELQQSIEKIDNVMKSLLH